MLDISGREGKLIGIIIGLVIIGVLMYMIKPVRYYALGVGYRIGIISCPKYFMGALPSDDAITAHALNFLYEAQADNCKK